MPRGRSKDVESGVATRGRALGTPVESRNSPPLPPDVLRPETERRVREGTFSSEAATNGEQHYPNTGNRRGSRRTLVSSSSGFFPSRLRQKTAFAVVLLVALPLLCLVPELSSFTSEESPKDWFEVASAGHYLPVNNSSSSTAADHFPLDDVPAECYVESDTLYKIFGDFRVYVYSDFPSVLEQIGPRKLGNCLDNQFASEIRVVRYLRKSPRRTLKLDEAHLVVVPVYPKCIRLRYIERHGVKDKSLVEDAIEIITHNVYLQVVKQLTELGQKPSARHVFIFPSGRGATIFPSWRESINDSIFLTPEAGFTEAQRDKAPYFEEKKDIIIPGYVPRVVALQQRSKPVAKRTFLVAYCGDFLKSPQRVALGELTRTSAEAWTGRRVIISDDCLTEEVATRSLFCLAPAGHSPWTSRFYEAIASGCIPVLFGTSFVPPFQLSIPYNSFVIRWPEDRIDLALLQHLADLPEVEVGRMMNRLATYAHHVLYNPQKTPNAYDMILRYLEHRYCTWTLTHSPQYLQQQLEELRELGEEQDSYSSS